MDPPQRRIFRQKISEGMESEVFYGEVRFFVQFA
jgi:hypothetical protein